MTTPETTKPDNAPETLKAPPGECSGGSPCSQFPFEALRLAMACMKEVADKCIMDAVNATDPYSKWACQERAKNTRASIAEIERLELDWCNGVICFANPTADRRATEKEKAHE